MARVRVRLNSRGMGELLTSPDVEAALMLRGERVAAAAEGLAVPPHEGRVDYLARSSPERNRARVLVVADHPGALGQEERYRILGGALDAAG